MFTTHCVFLFCQRRHFKHEKELFDAPGLLKLHKRHSMKARVHLAIQKAPLLFFMIKLILQSDISCNVWSLQRTTFIGSAENVDCETVKFISEF